jgi:hypothetical protein
MSSGDESTHWINSAYNVFDASFGISKFNQTVPLLISGVAVGVSLVNRNFPKCIGHVCGAAGVALISIGYIGFSDPCKQFTTAFLWYTVSYLMFCMQASDRLDSNTLVGIILSLIILVFVDLVSFLGNANCAGLGSKTYVVMLLMGIIGGISGFYITKSVWGNGALYDFGGCSCDDCNGSNCSVGCAKTFVAKQVSSQ